MKKIYILIFIVTFCFIGHKVQAKDYYEEYKFGDIIEYNGNSYHVIKDSNAEQEYVTALKDTTSTKE